MLNKILLALLAVLVIIQFIQIDKENPIADPAIDFMNIYPPSSEVATILKSACYDCHSYETEYPWYTYTQPLGWWVADHIEHGRDELNFAEFGNYTPKRADHKMEEGIEMVEEEEMPLPSYTWAHSEARLTWEERALIADWFKEVRATIAEANADSSAVTSEEEHTDGEDHDH